MQTATSNLPAFSLLSVRCGWVTPRLKVKRVLHCSQFRHQNQSGNEVAAGEGPRHCGPSAHPMLRVTVLLDYRRTPSAITV